MSTKKAILLLIIFTFIGFLSLGGFFYYEKNKDKKFFGSFKKENKEEINTTSENVEKDNKADILNPRGDAIILDKNNIDSFGELEIENIQNIVNFVNEEEDKIDFSEQDKKNEEQRVLDLQKKIEEINNYIQ